MQLEIWSVGQTSRELKRVFSILINFIFTTDSFCCNFWQYFCVFHLHTVVVLVCWCIFVVVDVVEIVVVAVGVFFVYLTNVKYLQLNIKWKHVFCLFVMIAFVSCDAHFFFFNFLFCFVKWVLAHTHTHAHMRRQWHSIVRDSLFLSVFQCIVRFLYVCQRWPYLVAFRIRYGLCIIFLFSFSRFDYCVFVCQSRSFSTYFPWIHTNLFAEFGLSIQFLFSEMNQKEKRTKKKQRSWTGTSWQWSGFDIEKSSHRKY